MKSKQKEKPVGLKKLQSLESAFLKKQEVILTELLTAIKNDEKGKKLKALVKKFEKNKDKLSILLAEIRKVEKAELAAKKAEEKKKIKANKKAKLKAEKSKKEKKKDSKKTAGSKKSKDSATIPKVFKVSRVAESKPIDDAASKSVNLNAKLAIAGMQNIKSIEELDQYLSGETRTTVLRRAVSRKNALADS